MAAKKTTVGGEAPLFTLPDADGKTVSLAGLRGSWIVLYFYPRDNTSGCTTEAIDFTAKAAEFKKLGAIVIGISPDSCASHQKFMIKHDLGITLLSDADKKTLKQYGAWGTKIMYGRESQGVVRSTFLIDPRGVIRHAWDKVRVAGHADDVLKTLRNLRT
ncbi:MAG: peroxiredoxin [Spirochaetes bacterium]|nr:peroxiredoxin [Spirochaetota bacterium]